MNALATLDALVLRTHQSAVKAQAKADAKAGQLGARHVGADRYAASKAHLVAEYGALRDYVANLTRHADNHGAWIDLCMNEIANLYTVTSDRVHRMPLGRYVFVPQVPE